MSAPAPVTLATLPDIERHALWNHASGLVVSLLGRELPEQLAERAKALKSRDYHLPRLLQDADIYLAFYPKRLPQSALFAPLALGPEKLESLIDSLAEGTLFALNEATMDAWISIEETLLSIIRTLMGTHPGRSGFPSITWPHWPEQTGYRALHSDKNEAFKCARHAKRAFIALSACATFAISLWLEQDEYRCFSRAWHALSTRPKDPIPLPFLDSLEESVVCVLDAGFRAGTFLSPYYTRWGPFFPYFIRARVPIWLIWGFSSRYDFSSVGHSNMRVMYFPPDSVIMDARKRQAQFSTTVLPSQPSAVPPPSNTAPPLPSAVSIRPSTAISATAPPTYFWSTETTAPPPPPGYIPATEAGSRQKSRESWEDFSARMREGYAKSLLKETETSKQSRLSREELAARQTLGKRTTVFTWEQDFTDRTFYRRTRVHKYDMISSYADAYPHQRIYWGHVNEWDIVGHLKAPPGVTVPDLYGSLDDEDDYDDDYSPNIEMVPVGLSTIDPPGLSAKVEKSMAAAVIANTEEAPAPPTVPTLQGYLRLRHGFTCPERSSWNPRLHCQNAYDSDQIVKTTGALLFSYTDVPPSIATSIIDCFNMVRNKTLRYTDLTPSWDMRWDLRVDLRTVSLQLVTMAQSTVFILSPPQGSSDDSPWSVALNSATAVLLVYRQGWEKMSDIAQGLLDLGIPFRTVTQSTQAPPQYNWAQKSRGLGIRPAGYHMTRWDYNAYLKSRDVILTSSAGRAIRLCGGLVGRIASEVVPDERVLDGPSLCDEVVAKLGDIYFLDDGVTDETLDRVSGVVHVSTGQGKVVSHISWWPKHDVFLGSGRFSDQWMPDAEKFYIDLLRRYTNGTFKPKSSSEWRATLKYKRVPNEEFINGSESLACEFLRGSSRVR